MVPALVASLIDITVTIVHQRKQGDLSQANEGNPLGALFMSSHVSGLFLISGIEVILIMTLGYYLPNRISKYPLLFVLIVILVLSQRGSVQDTVFDL